MGNVSLFLLYFAMAATSDDILYPVTYVIILARNKDDGADVSALLMKAMTITRLNISRRDVAPKSGATRRNREATP